MKSMVVEVIEAMRFLGGQATREELCTYLECSPESIDMPIRRLILHEEIMDNGGRLECMGNEHLVDHAATQDAKADGLLRPDYTWLALDELITIITTASEELATRTAYAEERLRKAQEAVCDYGSGQ